MQDRRISRAYQILLSRIRHVKVKNPWIFPTQAVESATSIKETVLGTGRTLPEDAKNTTPCGIFAMGRF